MTYEHKVTPFAHQEERFLEHRAKLAWGHWWEQGSGKTKTLLDTAAWLYEQGKINALIAVAPNGVHTNWVNDEIPAHLPDRIPHTIFHYRTRKAKTRAHKDAGWACLKTHGLAILCISYNGMMTAPGMKFLKYMLQHRRCLFVLDESHYIKSPGSKRTIRAIALGKYAAYRRTLTGTPMEQVFDVYAQIRFMDTEFWARRQLGSWEAFKTYFGVWRKMDGKYNKLIETRFLDVLNKYVAEITDRVRTDEVLDLPEWSFTQRYFEMNPEQRRVYGELRDQFWTELRSGRFVDAELPITRMLRLQQVACGYLPVGEEEPEEMLGKNNPRLDAAVELLRNLGHPALVFCRFRKDVDQLMDALGKQAGRYDGHVNDEEAEATKQAFQRGDIQFFVANTAKGGEGLTLTQARSVVYYSNYFSLIKRDQSQRRARRAGQRHRGTYIDLMAEGTIDRYIARTLREKKDLVSIVNGDTAGEWLE